MQMGERGGTDGDTSANDGSLQELLHALWQQRFKCNGLASGGMRNAQEAGVETEALAGLGGGMILWIANDGAANLGKLDADLTRVSSTRLR